MTDPDTVEELFLCRHEIMHLFQAHPHWTRTAVKQPPWQAVLRVVLDTDILGHESWLLVVGDGHLSTWLRIEHKAFSSRIRGRGWTVPLPKPREAKWSVLRLLPDDDELYLSTDPNDEEPRWRPVPYISASSIPYIVPWPVWPDFTRARFLEIQNSFGLDTNPVTLPRGLRRERIFDDYGRFAWSRLGDRPVPASYVLGLHKIARFFKQHTLTLDRTDTGFVSRVVARDYHQDPNYTEEAWVALDLKGPQS